MQLKSQFMYFFVAAPLLAGCEQNSSLPENGFDQICIIYTKTLSDPKHKDKNVQEILYLIDDIVTRQVKDINAIQAYTAVVNVNPDEKYKLFKESAEYVLKRQWDCPVMVNLNLYPIYTTV